MKPAPTAGLALVAGLALAAGAAGAQEFGLYLSCKGTVDAKGRTQPAHLDLAMRRNNQTALVQRSDVLPVGDRFRFETSPTHYSMVLRAPARGSVVYYDWLRGAVIVWDPDLGRMHAARLSVDRQSAVLEGEIADAQGRLLARLLMSCQPSDNQTAPEPRF